MSHDFEKMVTGIIIYKDIDFTLMGNFLKKDNKKNHHTRHNIVEYVVVFVESILA